MEARPPRCYRLADVVVDLDDGVLVRGGERFNLAPKTLDVLRFLVAGAPRLVAKEELLDGVWPEQIVEEAALTQRIKELRKLLGDDARSPRFIETVARRGYRLVAPVEEVPANLELGAQGGLDPRPSTFDPPLAVPAVPAPRAPSRSTTRWWTVGAVAVAAGVLAAAWALRDGSPGAASPAPERRRAVAVLPFRALAPDPASDWLKTALPELLLTDLSAGDRLRVISGETVARVSRELAFTPTDDLPRDMLHRLRTNLDAEIVVGGTYLAAPGGGTREVRVDVRVTDAATGELLVAFSESSAEGELLALVQRIGTRLRGALGVGDLSDEDVANLRAALPANVQAARHYAEGLAHLRVFNFPAARAALAAAVEADPGSPIVHAALADAWDWSGYDGRAREEQQRAVALAGKLGRAQQLRLEQGLHERLGEWERAEEIARALFAFFPEDLETGLSLVDVLSRAGKDRDAAATLASLRRLPPPAGSDPRIDLAEAWMLDDVPARKLEMARRSAREAEARGARFLLAAARVQEGMALARLGEPVKAREAYEDVRRIRIAIGDRFGVAKVLDNEGVLLAQQGELAAARRAFEEALAISAEIGSVFGEAWASRHLARVLAEQDDPGAARQALERAMESFVELGQPASRAAAQAMLARLVLNGGDVAQAETLALDARSGIAGQKARSVEAVIEAVLAAATAAQGRRDEAIAAAARSEQLLAASGDPVERLDVGILCARARALGGATAEAVVALDAAMAEARRLGLVALELEARLARAEAGALDPAARPDPAFRASLIADAQRLGFVRIARRAAALPPAESWQTPSD
jgi:DNA-binding winged helix-turn-helix (wHTH) protein/tetratricopeptide (TPR) repeat protein